MMDQVGQSHSPYLAWSGGRRAGVVHRPVVSSSGEDHGVKGRVLLELPVKEKIAWTGGSHISRNEERVLLPESLSVGKLRKGSVSGVPSLIAACTSAKKVCAKRCKRIGILRDGGQRRQRVQRHRRLPSLVVGM